VLGSQPAGFSPYSPCCFREGYACKPGVAGKVRLLDPISREFFLSSCSTEICFGDAARDSLSLRTTHNRSIRDDRRFRSHQCSEARVLAQGCELTVFVHVFEVPVTLLFGFLEIVQRKVRDAGSGVELGENIIVVGLVLRRSQLDLNSRVRASVEDVGIELDGLGIVLDCLLKLFLAEIGMAKVAVVGGGIVFSLIAFWYCRMAAP